MRVAVIGHDGRDAALAKRVGQMRQEGHQVTLLSFRRGDDPGIADLDLGRTRDGAFAQRLAASLRAVPKARGAQALRDAEIVWSRNLDTGLVALGALAGRATPLVYECLDVHDLLSGEGLRCRLARAAERCVVDRAALTVTSSPAFETEHFGPRYGERPITLIENRLARQGLPPRPTGAARRGPPLTIGWFGILRCARSLALLRAAAEAGVSVVLRGRPSAALAGPIAVAAQEVPNLTFAGPYEAPSDLSAIYAGVDLAWAGDWSQPGANSRWLLPNRLYEAGWFGVPVIVPAGTEAASWAERHGSGFVLEGDAQEALPALIEGMTQDRLAAARARVLGAPGGLFAAPPGEVSAALRRAAS